MTVDTANTTIAYTGGKITGLAVDDIKGILFIADAGSTQIVIYEYDEEIIKKNNKTEAYSLVLYDNVD